MACLGLDKELPTEGLRSRLLSPAAEAILLRAALTEGKETPRPTCSAMSANDTVAYVSRVE